MPRVVRRHRFSSTRVSGTDAATSDVGGLEVLSAAPVVRRPFLILIFNIIYNIVMTVTFLQVHLWTNFNSLGWSLWL